MKPHKHAELIKAWADGAEIEVQWYEDLGTNRWHPAPNPDWNTRDSNYRIKPERKQMRVLVGGFIEFGHFSKEDDKYEVALIGEDYEIKTIYEDDFDEEVGIRDWIDLDKFNGEIMFHARKSDLTDGEHKRNKR